MWRWIALGVRARSKKLFKYMVSSTCSSTFIYLSFFPLIICFLFPFVCTACEYSRWINFIIYIFNSFRWISRVDDIEVDMEMQKMTVTCWANQSKVLKTVRKMGRKAELWSFPYNPEYHNFAQYYYNQNDHQSYPSSTY